MKKLIGNLYTWQIVMIIFLLLCAFLVPYNCSLNSSTKKVRLQKLYYDEYDTVKNYLPRDSTVIPYDVDTIYKLGDLIRLDESENIYRIIP